MTTLINFTAVRERKLDFWALERRRKAEGVRSAANARRALQAAMIGVTLISASAVANAGARSRSSSSSIALRSRHAT